MNKKLLIMGASTYAVVASEIAADMGCFEKIGFVDDERRTTPNGNEVIGTTRDINELSVMYSNIIVAIGNSKVRLSLLNRIKNETPCHIVSLVSPKEYISPSAHIMDVLSRRWLLCMQIVLLRQGVLFLPELLSITRVRVVKAFT